MQLEDYTDDFGTHPGYRTTYKNHVTVTENNLLDKTNWMYVRQKERSIAIPAGVETSRAAITAEADRLRADIDSATSTDEVDTAFRSANWPEDN